jgi:Fe-S cluster biosynthesis and repair protein YggX
MNPDGAKNQPPSHDGTSRTVFCVKLRRELPALDEVPWPGELGQRIYENVSAVAWAMWEDRMRMVLNEYHLIPWQPEAQDFMAKIMEDFLFGGDGNAEPANGPDPSK